MLGEKVAESTGRVTGRRVMPGGKVEVSFEAAGKVLGIEEREIGTYASAMRPDGTLYGEGQGVIMGKGGEQAMWVGSGVGTIKPDGSVSYRGAVLLPGRLTGLGPLERRGARVRTRGRSPGELALPALGVEVGGSDDIKVRTDPAGG